jgi:hypothetical protein
MHAPATSPEPPKPPRRNPLYTRLFWFIAGAGLNYLLISTPFKYLRAHSGLPPFAISALSVGVASVFFFVWNLLVNFRTDSRKRDALARYCAAVCLMWLLSSSLLNFLKSFDAHHQFQFFGIALDLDVVATQFFLSGLKFALYHLWVFPVPKKASQAGGNSSVS